MADDTDKDSKTEDPTAKQLSKARSEGNVAISQEIKSLVALLGGLVMIAFLAPWLMNHLTQYLSVFLSQTHTFPMDSEGVRSTLASLLSEIGWMLAGPFAITVVAAFIANMGQVGLLYTPKKLQPKLSSIKPQISRLASTQKLVDVLKDIFKISIVVMAAALFVVPIMPHPDVLSGKPMSTTMEDLYWLIVLLLVSVIIPFFAVAVLDMIWTRHQHTTKLKMTKQEVKDEHKQSEGDPAVKGRIRSMRVQRSRQRMMAAVPEASVVITNPTHYAVALKYDMDDMAAPKLVAKGMDFIAARIREVAKEHDIPIVENPPLARALHAAVELDEEIPQDHYKAVAEVIGYVMRLKGAGKTR